MFGLFPAWMVYDHILFSKEQNKWSEIEKKIIPFYLHFVYLSKWSDYTEPVEKKVRCFTSKYLLINITGKNR